MYKKFSTPYHPGALKYFADNKIEIKATPIARSLQGEVFMAATAFAPPRRISLAAVAAVAVWRPAPRSAQTYGFATLPPGTLNHTTASAISKVMKEKGGVNMLVQPTAGDNVINPMVGRGEVEIGITNIMEAQDALDGGLEGHAHHHRRPCAAHAVLRAQGLRHVQDRRPQGQARDDGLFRHAQHRQATARAMLATAGLTEADVKPVLVPNVVRSADDFMAGNADMFYFAFGGPKVREADATVGGIRVLEMDEAGMPAARKIMPWGYASRRSGPARSSPASRSR